MREKKFSFLVDDKPIFAWAEKKMDIMNNYSKKGTIITAPEIKRCLNRKGQPIYKTRLLPKIKEKK